MGSGDNTAETSSSSSACVDGVCAPLEDASVSLNDRGFLYGDSAFEVIRTYGEKPFRLTAHLDRLEKSCRILGISFPMSVSALEQEVRATLAFDRERGTAGERYIRVVITRGRGPLRYDPNTAKNPTRVVIVAPLTVPSDSLYENGATAVCLRVSRLVDDPRGAGTKASNYLPNLLAGEEARRLGADEALVTAACGEVLEGTTSNLFVVTRGRVMTPPLSTGILAGITREVVLSALDALSLELVETMLFPSDLYRADEVFITSSIREVIPLVRVDGAPIGEGQPGPTTRQIHQAFREQVARELFSSA